MADPLGAINAGHWLGRYRNFTSMGSPPCIQDVFCWGRSVSRCRGSNPSANRARLVDGRRYNRSISRISDRDTAPEPVRLGMTAASSALPCGSRIAEETHTSDCSFNAAPSVHWNRLRTGGCRALNYPWQILALPYASIGSRLLVRTNKARLRRASIPGGRHRKHRARISSWENMGL